jgi:hypothetical protein
MQRHAIDQLHDDRGALPGLLNVVKQPDDIRNVERSQQVGLGPEAGQEVWVTKQPGRKVLDRHPLPARLMNGGNHATGCSPAEWLFFGITWHNPRTHG